MNIYNPLAQCRETRARLLNAAAWLSRELPPDGRCARNVLEARDALSQMADAAWHDAREIESALQMDRDALFDMLASRYGHSIYWEQESAVVRSMIHICAEQYQDWGYRECAKAIADKYDADRLGDSL